VDKRKVAQISPEKLDDVVFNIHEYDIDTVSNSIYLMGTQDRATGVMDILDEPGIDYTIANKFIRNLNILMGANPGKSILIHMKSCGGYWEEGLAIKNAIETCPSPTTILCYTHARSMTSMIFLAANKRVMMPDSVFMYHTGSMEFKGTSRLLQTEAGREKLYKDKMLGFYVDALREQGNMRRWSRGRIKNWLEYRMMRDEDVFLEDLVGLPVAPPCLGQQYLEPWVPMHHRVVCEWIDHLDEVSHLG